ncbi:MAG: hypothetical protein VX985_01065, partial [SAR324 cluster bacterium]|nr:hypothetical protein [SAR324 cluster bacterium]
MLVNYNNVAQTLKLSIKADFVLLLFGLVMSVLGGPAFAIDYFEITKPKFIPVKVGLIGGRDTEVVAVKKIFRENLEKVLYFQIIDGTREEFA